MMLLLQKKKPGNTNKGNTERTTTSLSRHDIKNHPIVFLNACYRFIVNNSSYTLKKKRFDLVMFNRFRFIKNIY